MYKLKMRNIQETILILCVISMFTMVGCSKSDVEKEGPEAVKECNIDSDCVLPMNLSLGSDCLFTSNCVKSKCIVACPMSSDDPYSEGSRRIPQMCEEDSDCSCFVRRDVSKGCICHKNKCLSIEG